MSRLVAEFSRLYLVPDPGLPAQGHLVASDATVKAMVLEIARPADWTDLSVVWSGAQSELELPPAGIAVSGTDGLQLWFSVAEPVKAQDAATFLSALQDKYLSATPAKRVALYPSGTSAAAQDILHARAVPLVQKDTGNWSAFVSPDLASVFGDEPWLDLPPNPDQQADILSRLKPMKRAQFYDVLNLLGGTTNQALPAAAPKALTPQKMGPKEFLTQVMNDPAVGLKERIEAAKALLPYAS